MEFTKEQIIEISKQLGIDINTKISDKYFVTSVGNTSYRVEYNNKPFFTIKEIILNKGKNQLKNNFLALFEM